MVENDEFEVDEPEEQKTEPTATDKFTEAMKQYSDVETARSHITEIAQEIGCAKSLGYKVLHRLEDEGHFKKQQTLKRAEAKEPTVKIPEAKVTTEPTTEEEEFEVEEGEGEELPEQFREEPETPMYEEGEAIETLKPVFERAIGRLLDNGADMIVGEGTEQFLTPQETKDTAILLPFLIGRITKQKLNEDNFIDLTTGVHFGSIILKVVKAKMRQRKRKQEAVVQPPPTPEPEPEPTPEPPKSTLVSEATKELKKPDGKTLLQKLK